MTNKIYPYYFTMGHSVMEEVPEVKLHTHDHYEIFWFIDGNAVYSVEGNIYQIEKNDILVTNMRELHAPIFLEGGRYERTIIHVRPAFLSEFITEEYNPFAYFENREPGVGNLITAKIAAERGLHELILRIEEHYKKAAPESNAMIKALLIELLVAISKNAITKSKPHRENVKIAAVLKYINENLSNDLSFEVLEKEFFISRFYLSHLFKAQTGFTICEYISNKRIMKSRELMLENLGLSEISEQAGFSDYSSFYRNFKKIVGVSPRVFLKSNK